MEAVRRVLFDGEGRTDDVPRWGPKPYRAGYTKSNAGILLDDAGVWHGLKGPEISRNDLA
jgi:hypothetical protein